MPAERDSSQGTTFIYSNFYQLYRQGKLQAETQKEGLMKGKILRTFRQVETPVPAEVQVIQSKTSADWNRWVQSESTHARTEVRNSMKQLRDLSQRLKFLSEELDELLKRS